MSGDEHQLRLERWEVALASAALEDPGRLPREREAALRWALGLARIRRFGGIDLEPLLARFRDEVVRTLGPVLGSGRVDLDAAAMLAPVLAARAAVELARLGELPLDRAALEEEIRQKKLVLALGGGGGTAWVHLGAFRLLEEEGLRPALIAGASMGAVLGLLRARSAVYDQGQVVHTVRSLRLSTIFRSGAAEGRYGLPGALRLRLPSEVLPGAEEGLRFSDLPIPLVVAITGLRKEELPRPVSFYRRLLPANLFARRRILPRSWQALAEAASELVRTRGLLALRVGGVGGTTELDPLDAVGFSCALPGLIQYEVPEDPRRQRSIGRLLEAHGIGWLLDGGLTDNVPARAAWQAVQEGTIGSRNALILALDGFSPRLSSGIWIPLQRIARENVRRSLEYAHAVVTYSRTLSPTEILPSLGGLIRAIDLGRSQLAHQMPLVRKLTSPLPPLPHVASTRVRMAV
ncbi:MAG: patatin-like phospholipase family protein [Pseudomonadota bacterium]